MKTENGRLNSQFPAKSGMFFDGELPSVTVTVPKRLLNVKGMATYLGRSEAAVYQLVARREIPFLKIGRAVSFDLKEIDAWIDSHRVKEEL